MHLFLVRHGQSYVNLEDWAGGHVDAGLTPLGQQQAERLAVWMARTVQITALYTSTMKRAQETAAYLARAAGIAAQSDDRLREFGHCYADGRAVPSEAAPIEYAEFWGTERPYTRIKADGESWLLFRLRIGTFLDDVIARHANRPADDGPAEGPGDAVVVVCHGGVIDAVFDYMFNVGPHRRVEVLTHNTGITHFEYCPDRGRESWRLHAHGLPLHLLDADNVDSGGHGWLGSRPVLRDVTRPPGDDGTGDAGGAS
ncbi:MAG: histidine phosphatase family protein [Anaerolineae bacterium]|nr:histidine phosphatase family protein [Anaerolineae bacterium]